MSLFKYFFCLLYFGLIWTDIFQSEHKIQLVSLRGGYIEVKGSTNINTFSCGINNYLGNDTLKFTNTGTSIKGSGLLKCDVIAFNCKMKPMTADLLKTLNESKYPHFYIKIYKLSKMPNFRNNEVIPGSAQITLSGVSVNYDMNFRFSINPNGTIMISGKKQINFSDFRMIPPSKVGGMIKTNQQLDVEFKILFIKSN